MVICGCVQELQSKIAEMDDLHRQKKVIVSHLTYIYICISIHYIIMMSPELREEAGRATEGSGETESEENSLP